MYELKMYRGVKCHDNAEWCEIGREIDLSIQNLQIFVPRLKKSDFILDSKIAELNQNENWK